MDELESHTVTILLLGDSGVGKSTFLSYVSPRLLVYIGHVPTNSRE